MPLLILPWRLFSTGSPHIVKQASADIADEGWTLSRAMRHHAFWALFSTFFFTAIGMYAIAPQVVAYLIDAGFPPLQAATAWGFSGVVLLFGMLGVSWLDGIIGRRPSVLLQLRDVDLRDFPALAVAVVSEHMGADRLCRLLRQHDRLARPVADGNRDEAVSGKARRNHLREHFDRQRARIGVRLLERRPDPRRHAQLQSAARVYALIAVVLGMIPFLVVPALRR